MGNISDILGASFGGLDSVGNIVGSILNYYAVKDTNRTNKELSELAYQRNIEQWNRENAYNHPSSQMSRLREAGLNPNLVYGNGSAVQVSAHSPQMSYSQMQAPHVSPVNFGILQTAMDAVSIRKISAEADRVENEARKLWFDGLNSEQQVIYQKIRNSMASIDLEYYYEQKLNDLAIQEAERMAKEQSAATGKAQELYYNELGNTERERQKQIQEQMVQIALENDFFSFIDEDGKRRPNANFYVREYTKIISPLISSLGNLITSIADVKNLFFNSKEIIQDIMSGAFDSDGNFIPNGSGTRTIRNR